MIHHSFLSFILISIELIQFNYNHNRPLDIVQWALYAQLQLAHGSTNRSAIKTVLLMGHYRKVLGHSMKWENNLWFDYMYSILN